MNRKYHPIRQSAEPSFRYAETAEQKNMGQKDVRRKAVIDGGEAVSGQ